jgi:hypothetical protein
MNGKDPGTKSLFEKKRKMLKWHEASTFNGVGAEHIPLYGNDDFQLVVNYRKGYESTGGWVPGCFFVGVLCKNPRYGNLFIDKMDHLPTAKDAVKWVWEFTGFPHVSIKELERIIDTNGNLPSLEK